MWSPFWSILACKIPQFRAKATDSDSHHVFLESRHSEVTKNLYCFVAQREPKKVSAHGISVMGLSHVFQIVQVVSNRAKHNIYNFDHISVRLKILCNYSKLLSKIMNTPSTFRINRVDINERKWYNERTKMFT